MRTWSCIGGIADDDTGSLLHGRTSVSFTLTTIGYAGAALLALQEKYDAQ